MTFSLLLCEGSRRQIVLNDSEVVGQERLLYRQYGRFRDIKQGPDGFLYIATSDNDGYGAGRAGGDRIIRLIPRSQQSSR